MPGREVRPFVSVRVAEIQETVGSEQFCYIKSKYNPADALTSGIAPEDLESSMSGPAFLKLPETEWPQFQDNHQARQQERADTSKEIKVVMKQKQVDKTIGSLTVQELLHSASQLLKWSQLHKDVLPHLDKRLIAKTDKEGLIRAHGRLEKCKNARILLKEIRNPIELPRDHQLAIFLLRHLHQKQGHCSYKRLMHKNHRKDLALGFIKNMASRFRECEHCRVKHLIQYLDSAKLLWNQVLKPKAPDHDKALGSEIIDKVNMIYDAVKSLEEKVKRRQKTGAELFCDSNSLIDGTLQLIDSYKLPPICDVFDLTDAGPGVGVSNTHVRFRDAEIVRLHSSARKHRIHRARNDSGQNEADRTNAVIGSKVYTMLPK
ncbi:hypothetical protein ACROYT_G014427 [Oculina patagonica]